MGYLFYGSTAEPIEIPDRLLAHIKLVVATKLRRSESFMFSWRHPDAASARSTIWLQPAIPLRFVFHSDAEIIDATVLRRLAEAANSSKGLVVDLDMLDDPGRLEGTRYPGSVNRAEWLLTVPQRGNLESRAKLAKHEFARAPTGVRRRCQRPTAKRGWRRILNYEKARLRRYGIDDRG